MIVAGICCRFLPELEGWQAETFSELDCRPRWAILRKMLEWLSSDRNDRRLSFDPRKTDSQKRMIQLDYVGSLANAAKVISLLHQGEKRLVFCDSRSRVEQIAVLLRQYGIDTFVSHSSLRH